MNIHDVSDTPEHFEQLAQQKRNLQDAQSRKGQRPLRKPRAQTVLQFLYSRMARPKQQDAAAQNQHYISSSFVPPPYPPCIQPFSALAKVMIDDLLLETHHRGKYLVLRTVTPQNRLTGVMAIVEDERGDVLLLQLYHQEETGAAEDILVEGMVVIVKEPYLKVTSHGGYGLRVDHIYDIEFLAGHDERIPVSWCRAREEKGFTAATWKEKGNDCFSAGQYRGANEWWVLETRRPCPLNEFADRFQLHHGAQLFVHHRRAKHHQTQPCSGIGKVRLF
jgi:hypothetical protein